MPQTEVLIHIVIDGERTIDYDAQSAIHGAAVSATIDALGGSARINRNAIEVRAVSDEAPEEPQAADAAQASAPAPVEADPAAATTPIPAEGASAPGDTPIPGEHPAPHAPPQAAPQRPTT
jgi:hypothetical protein